MKVFSVKELATSHLTNLKSKGFTIGFVPTMGALHEGHLSLIKDAQKDNDFVVVSIFVNPTQFNNEGDLDKYPRTLEEDLKKLKSVDCDFVFTPSADEMYNKNEKAEVFNFNGLDKEMEGKFRDNHFNGVGTIVKKFFEIIRPNNAYFGEKDFQQLQIIKKLVTITKQPVNIVGCPIDREQDGLARSSRNVRLTEEHRNSAHFIYKTICKAKEMFIDFSPNEIEKWVEKEFRNHSNLVLEYFTIAKENDLKPAKSFDNNYKYRAFIAVFADEIRLIDNVAL